MDSVTTDMSFDLVTSNFRARRNRNYGHTTLVSRAFRVHHDKR
jgi:hypothetical protein